MRILLFLFGFLNFNQMPSAQTEDWNLNFEEWIDSTLAPADHLFNGMDFNIELPYNGDLKGWTGLSGMLRTNDAIEGNYAVVVHRWYNYVDGLLALGNCDLFETEKCAVSSTVPFSKLKGYYKFFVTDTNPAMTPRAEMCLIISGFENGVYHDSLAYASFQFTPKSEYTFFEASIQSPFEEIQMDSLRLSFASIGKVPSLFPIHNFLFLDDITFESSSAITNPRPQIPELAIIPNPCKARFRIELDFETNQYAPMNLYDGLGRIVRANLPLNEDIDISELPAGVFYLQALNGNNYWQCLKFIHE